jgi:Tfp pilus assembly protein PilE
MQMIDSIGIEMAHASEPVQMYYKLLTVKVQEKQKIRHSSSAMMRSVLDYYEQQGDPTLLSEAYYCMGCTYRDLKVYSWALENFQKALDFVAESDDLSLKSDLYREIASLLTKQELYDNALFTYQQAFLCDSLQHDVSGMVYTLRDIGLIFRQRQAYDSVYYYFRRAENLATAQGDLTLRNVAALEIAEFQLIMHDYDNAWKTLQPVLAKLNSENRSKANLIAAQILWHKYEYEKVPHYLSEVMTYGNYEEKSELCRIMADIAYRRKDYKEYGNYMSRYSDFKTRSFDGDVVAVMAEMNSLYNYQQALKENASLAQKGERKSQTIALVVGIIAILALLALMAYTYYLRKREAMHAKLQELESDQLEQKRLAERSITEKMERIRNLEDLLQQSGNENSTLRQHVEEMQQELNQQVAKEMKQIKVRENADSELKHTDIYRRIIYLINRKHLLLQKDFEQLRDTFDTLYPDFMKRLLELCEMSDLEIEISLLRRMGVSPNDIASLTDYSKAHISGVRRSLYTKAFGIKGAPSDWDDFIASL